MRAAAPFASERELLAAGERAFDRLGPADWQEAFAAHARIGEARDGDRHGSREQAGATVASPETLAALRSGNAAYEARFGHVFLIRAAGRSAEEILAELQRRLQNTPGTEFRNATAQQREITRGRLLAMTR